MKITQDAQDQADELGVKIFKADIIYHLFDSFTKHVASCVEDRKKEMAGEAVFPCIVKIIKNSVFHKSNPILVGLNVKHGILKIGTPLCVPDKDFVKIGRVTGIEIQK